MDFQQESSADLPSGSDEAPCFSDNGNCIQNDDVNVQQKLQLEVKKKTRKLLTLVVTHTVEGDGTGPPTAGRGQCQGKERWDGTGLLSLGFLAL